MREACRELLFADEDTAAKAHRDPVAPTKRSEKAPQKIAPRTLQGGTPVHSFALCCKSSRRSAIREPAPI